MEYITDEWKDRFSKSPEPVENLIKLIKLRLSATEAKISLIRETISGIRIYTPYSKAEWNLVSKTLPSTLQNLITIKAQ